jgi:hypothetical protein
VVEAMRRGVNGLVGIVTPAAPDREIRRLYGPGKLMAGRGGRRADAPDPSLK